ncbi:hypothetical protein TUN199_07869 [Pyrenophora tritici-repentis]|uniref:Atrophin-1 multi-domain protein n=2 Tax=Pyrenophora tritici-repentis TaxID=45151 RepID=A0A2W1H423_9PLEO|nr:uncharacterized protein PTRG_07507 [Pyrenophora tritici-repentis Pt-1C-BFP]KAF7564409.1 Atrophin-1 multi-domain protein [Pyrenophora tritici-repentis]EDU50426.1 predicted protein [Pyrenophora tritici-repentis Pt-1C-BFP]KAI0583533.1 hypothetical protein Alg130_05594 [Pyrenophora tritici-repentis]KAI0605668.1 hypothetical protein TUN205_10083 [Pyrenophora tritici-repentis]KAI0620130.1 hypothetical protein TUN199_07869 [Pyrenophora tritici-repentis]
MSTNAPAEAKKRKQAKKTGGAEDASRSKKPSTSTKASSAPEEEKKTAKKTPTLAKSSKPIPTKKDTPAQPPPRTSKILDAVRAKGTTLGKIRAIENKYDTIVTASLQTDSEIKHVAIQAPQRNDPEDAAALLSKHGQTAQGTTTTTPPQATTTAQASRGTTIELPRTPKPAPSPVTITTPPSYPSHTLPLKPPPAHPANRPHTHHHPLPGKPAARIIEPTPNTALPPKYRPAARRVTAIIVGLPFVIVMGWELWERWNGKVVPKRFGDGDGGAVRGKEGV